ncbi:hypothetical protein OY671_010917, partial [Metschnikowia pulcherrima]
CQGAARPSDAGLPQDQHRLRGFRLRLHPHRHIHHCHCAHQPWRRVHGSAGSVCDRRERSPVRSVVGAAAAPGRPVCRRGARHAGTGRGRGRQRGPAAPRGAASRRRAPGVDLHRDHRRRLSGGAGHSAAVAAPGHGRHDGGLRHRPDHRAARWRLSRQYHRQFYHRDPC